MQDWTRYDVMAVPRATAHHETPTLCSTHAGLVRACIAARISADTARGTMFIVRRVVDGNPGELEYTATVDASGRAERWMR